MKVKLKVGALGAKGVIEETEAFAIVLKFDRRRDLHMRKISKARVLWCGYVKGEKIIDIPDIEHVPVLFAKSGREGWADFSPRTLTAEYYFC